MCIPVRTLSLLLLCCSVVKLAPKQKSFICTLLVCFMSLTTWCYYIMDHPLFQYKKGWLNIPFYLKIGWICIPSSAIFAVGTIRLNFATKELGFLIESSPPKNHTKNILAAYLLSIIIFSVFWFKKDFTKSQFTLKPQFLHLM